MGVRLRKGIEKKDLHMKLERVMRVSDERGREGPMSYVLKKR